MPRKRGRIIPFSRGPVEVISEKDRIGNHLSNVMIHVLFLVIISVFIFPVISLIFLNTEAKIGSIILFIVASPMYKFAFQNRSEVNLYNLKNSILYVSKNQIIQFISLTLLNVYLLFTVGFQTLIPTTILLLTYVCLSLITLLASRSAKRKYFRSFCLIPFIFNTLLLTNYLISFNEKDEFYYFYKNYETVYDQSGLSHGSKIEQSTLITLKDNAYEKYYGIRIFLNYDEMTGAKGVRYTFKKGIFGIRVLTNYCFY